MTEAESIVDGLGVEEGAHDPAAELGRRAPTVYHIPVCPFSQRLEILLTLKGCRDLVDFHVVDITRPRPGWLLEKTLGTTALPVLETERGGNSGSSRRPGCVAGCSDDPRWTARSISGRETLVAWARIFSGRWKRTARHTGTSQRERKAPAGD